MNNPDNANDVTVTVATADADLPGSLVLPDGAAGLVIFAHGAGSNRRSPRNGKVAELLNQAGFATLVFDLLTEKEQERYSANVFDMGLLTRRLRGVVEWSQANAATKGLLIGLNGASTGAGAALNVAAELGEAISAVVSRGGRPDLAEPDRLPQVTAPTLLIVGAEDAEVIPLNESAAANLSCTHEIKLVPGATHVFEESGTLEVAADMTVDWFRRHLA